MIAQSPGDPTGFDQWIRSGLKQQFERVLAEPLPGELLTLLGEPDAALPGQ